MDEAGSVDEDLRQLPVDLMQPDFCRGVPTTGRCRSEAAVEACLTDRGGNQYVATIPCAPSERCVQEGHGAYCKLIVECRDGQTRCEGNTLQECRGGTWRGTACPAGTQCRTHPGIGAQCEPGGTGVVVRGTLRYQHRRPRADLTGYEGPFETAAPGVLVVIAEGTEVLGSGFTGSGDAEPGSFSVATRRVPGAMARALFVPIALFDDDSPALAVAVPYDGTTYDKAVSLWSYAVSSLPPPTGGVINLGTLQVSGESAGALYIFHWNLFLLQRQQRLFGRVPQQSLVILWKPGLAMFCGACFLNRSFGGTDIDSLHFDTTIMLGGHAASPSHWSPSVIAHEYGHFVMDQYSKSPGEGGPHDVAQASKPGLAWSEGFATFAGQTALSEGQPSPNPIYFDVQEGTAFWVDLGRAVWSGGALELPNPHGPLSQPINENVVAAMMWDLWRLKGDLPMFHAVTLPRVVGRYNRGYPTVDFVDYADALQCARIATPAELVQSLRTRYRYPWDGMPLCP